MTRAGSYLSIPFTSSIFIFMINEVSPEITDRSGYQNPPDAITNIINAAPTPGASLSPSGKWMLLLEKPNLPSIEEVAQPELRLAGIRINPRTNGSSRPFYYNGFSIKSLTDFTETKVSGLPADPKIENVSWSPKGTKIAFTNTIATGLELWLIDLAKATAKKITTATVNDAISGLPYRWFSDGTTILYKAIVDEREDAPEANIVPSGPVIQENKASMAPVRTYQDLLKNKHDEALFTYYTTSQLKTVNLQTGKQNNFGAPAIISNLQTSPDGNYILVTTIQTPFSYLVPYARFATQIEVVDRKGHLVKTIASIPSSEDIPKGFGAVRKGPRSFGWRSDLPATLIWVEAQDEGDPKNEVAIRDQMYVLPAPFTAEARPLIAFQLRYGGVEWGHGTLAICYEWWWNNRQLVTSQWEPDHPEKGKVLLSDRSWEDSYNDPGDFVSERNIYGRNVLLEKDGNLYFNGKGASAEGNRPFVDTFELATKKTTRLWRSEAPYYERPVSIKQILENIILTARESNEEPPNYFFRNIKTGELTQITDFENPYKILKSVKKELIQYKRADGLDLTATLYTPPNYIPEKDGKLPALMWAYPREYKSADAAGQVKDSPYEFIQIGWFSPVFWVTQGYAVLDDFGMPIVGEGDEEPNETFIEQLVMDAEAAAKSIVDRGIADPKRLAVGGHSYGAFMTANLLAHSDIFAAGIARSGAYNRTLTPYGFQSEERTFWEAPETYFKMSPFMHADKIKAPLLLIHGDADNNSGTYPMQSERFYAALKGQGAPVRLVMLPHESHSYRAKESVMHMLWEMHNWLERHL